jgi:hypothetical protein
MYHAWWTYEFHKIFQLTRTVLFRPTRFGSSEGHLQWVLMYWSQLASTCIVVAVVYQIIIWLKTLVMSLLMYLKSLKQTKVVSILVVVLNWVKWCKLNARSFYSINKYDKKWKNLICFSDFKYINSDITNVFNQTTILYTTMATIQLHGSWLQYVSTLWRWPSDVPKRIKGKRIVHVSWKILWNSNNIICFMAECHH